MHVPCRPAARSPRSAQPQADIPWLCGWRCQTAPFALMMLASCVAGVRVVALGEESSHGGIGFALSCFALYIAWALFSVSRWMRIGVWGWMCCVGADSGFIGWVSVHTSMSVCLLKGCLTLGFVPTHWRCEAAQRFSSLLRCRAVRCAPPGPALWARRVRALHACAALIPCLVASVGVVRSRGARRCAKDARRVLGECSTDAWQGQYQWQQDTGKRDRGRHKSKLGGEDLSIEILCYLGVR
jgi:hypothetical protein